VQKKITFKKKLIAVGKNKNNILFANEMSVQQMN
jgi:hypothetical protein